MLANRMCHFATSVGTEGIGFLYLYNYGGGTISPFSTVEFDQPVVNLSSKMSFSSPSNIMLTAPGKYSVRYTAIPLEAEATLALFLNGEEIPGSRFTSDVGPISVNSNVAFKIDKTQIPATLTLVNVDPSRALKLQAETLPNTVNLSLEIIQIID